MTGAHSVRRSGGNPCENQRTGKDRDESDHAQANQGKRNPTRRRHTRSPVARTDPAIPAPVIQRLPACSLKASHPSTANVRSKARLAADRLRPPRGGGQRRLGR
jgi:hypothetical protein